MPLLSTLTVDCVVLQARVHRPWHDGDQIDVGRRDSRRVAGRHPRLLESPDRPLGGGVRQVARAAEERLHATGDEYARIA